MATSESPVVVIDGARLEGGGQILRNAVAYSCLTRKPIRIHNIRAGRSTPGLRPQHLTGMQMLADISGGKLIDANVGSTEVTFFPGEFKGGGVYEGDTKTAGSVALLLQAALPCLLLNSASESTLILKGGTNAEMAPQIDFFTFVMAPVVERFGVKFELDVIRRGYYPKGGGEVRVKIPPLKSLTSANLLTRGEVSKVFCRSFVAGVLPLRLAEEVNTAAEQVIRSHVGASVPITTTPVKEANAVGNGCGVTLVATTTSGCVIGADKLGKRGVDAATVGREAAEALSKELRSDACVDEHMQDQLIVFMALASGSSSVKVGKISLHTQTAIWVAELMTGVKFTTKTQSDGTNVIECQGVGYENPNLSGKLASVYGKDWYTQKVEVGSHKRQRVGEGDRLASGWEDSGQDKSNKLKDVFESSAW